MAISHSATSANMSFSTGFFSQRNPVDTWISERFMKRECVVIIPTSRDSKKCGCGRYLAQHYYFEEENDCVKEGSSVKWSITRCTTTLPTDAYGTLTFHGVLGQNKARYIRLDFGSDPLDIWHLLVDIWGLELPKLVITVHGGGNDFDLSPSILRAFKKGLLKAAKTTSAWIITSGIRLGVVRHVTAALSEVSGRNKLKHVNVIGFAPWGLVRRSDDLVGINENTPYYPTHTTGSTSSSAIDGGPNVTRSSRYVSLCEGHTCFLLVDNGTSGRPGAEAFLRRRFEDFLRQQPLLHAGESHQSSMASKFGRLMPMVCLVVNGGRSAIHSVMSYVSTSPPVPVVVCSGTGRAADLIAYAYRNMTETDGELDPAVRQRLLSQIIRTMGVGEAEANRLLKSVLLSVRRRRLITIYGTGGPSGDPEQNMNTLDDTGRHQRQHLSGLYTRNDGSPRGTLDAISEDDLPARIMSGHEGELDYAMLNALLKGQNTSPVDKLNLLLTWNREDMAREIFETGGHEWPDGSLDQAMMNALIYDRVDFVRLLLSRGMDMDRFLTIARLEELYNSDKGPSNTLRFIVQDVIKEGVGPSYRYRLPHVGLVIEKLMGFGFRSNYCRQDFRKRYKAQQLQRKISVKDAPVGLNDTKDENTTSFENAKFRRRLNTYTSSVSACKPTQHFPYPFHDLFLWAVLTNRQEMAMCFWQHGEELLARALIAYKLQKSLADEAEEDYLEVEICQQLKRNANEFKNLAYELLEQCYQSDDDLTLQLLTYELRQWSKWNCISLAAMANYKKFVAHQCCQILLADLWLGGLRIRKNANLKVVVGVLLPPTILAMHFKSKEELLLQAQTAEEFEENRNIAKGTTIANEEDDGNTSTTTTTSSSSNEDDSELELEPKRSKKKKTDKRRDHARDQMRDNKDEESGGILHPVTEKQHEEAHQRSLEQRSDRKAPVVTGYQTPRVEFRLSDGYQAVNEPNQPTTTVTRSSISEEIPATGVSSPVISLSARHSLAFDNGDLGGSPSSYRVAVGIEPSSAMFSSNVPDSQRSLLHHDRSKSASLDHTSHHMAPPIAAGGPRFSPVISYKQRTPTFSEAASRKLQSMVLLKATATPSEIPKLAPIKQHQQLNLKKKVQEFYSAPIATFWSFTIGYLLFLSFFTFIVLVRTPLDPSWPEYYVMSFIFTFAIDHGRMILVQEPKHFLSKLRVFCYHPWDICTLAACFMFFLAVFFRVSPETLYIGRVMYCVNIVFWYMRTLHLLTVSSKLGPFINMYGKMVLKMVLLINILFVVLASFGVFRQSIMEPHRDWSWELLRNIVYKPYFMLYGELYAEEIDKCGDYGSKFNNETGYEENCVPGFWLTPLFMTVYLLLSIVVFLNMMIAAFNYVFMEVNSQAQEIWKFQRYEQVIEYEQQPFLPPPFVVFAHLYWIGKYVYRRLWKKEKSYRFEHTLKLFLSSNEISKLHEFERECLEEMLAKKKEQKASSVEERMRHMGDRIEHLSSRMDDFHDRMNNALFTITLLEQKMIGGPLQQRILPTQASLPLNSRYGLSLHPTLQRPPTVSAIIPTDIGHPNGILPSDENRRLSRDVSAVLSPTSALDATNDVLLTAPSSDHFGVHLDRSGQNGIGLSGLGSRPLDRYRSPPGSGAAAVAYHHLGIGTESPTASFSRTQTWGSGLGDVMSCDDFPRIDHESVTDGSELKHPVEFISGADVDDGSEDECK